LFEGVRRQRQSAALLRPKSSQRRLVSITAAGWVMPTIIGAAVRTCPTTDCDGHH
jgi:hypothetical protein